MQPIILASSSPRRRELLALAGLPFEVSPAAAEEVSQLGETPEAFAGRMSRTKARLAAARGQARVGLESALMIGADTIVVLDDGPGGAGEIIGKPRDARQAVETLRRLRGRTHRVLTALTLIDCSAAPEVELNELVTARVPMREYSDEEIDAYVATGNPLDKAGAYAIQYAGFQPVDLARFADCFANVMGLPVCRLLRLLEARGVPASLDRAPGDCERFDPNACPIFHQINMESSE